MGKHLRHSGRRYVVVALAIILTAGVAWGIAAAFTGAAAPARAENKLMLKLGWTQPPDNLNPFIGYQSSSYEIWSINYDLLCGFDAATLENLQGDQATGLATSWEHSADGLTWTFHLRPNVKWSDGEPFTADDVAFTFNYIIDNELSAFTMYTALIDRVEATDDVTAVFHCSKPKGNMTGLWVPILPEHIWSKIDPKIVESRITNDPSDKGEYGTHGKPMIGTGPYQVVEWKKKQYVHMVANPYYWRNKPAVTDIYFQDYTNTDSMMQEVKQGTIDGAWGLAEAQYLTLKNDTRVTTDSYESIGVDELGFNCYTGKASKGNPVLKDWKFRQALNWAIDKEKIISVAYGGHGAVADSLCLKDYYQPELDWHWNPPADQVYTFDIEMAKQKLDEAGYTDTNGDGIRDYQGKPIELRLWAVADNETYPKSGKLIAGWLSECGLKIDFLTIEPGAASDKMYAYDDAGNFAPDYDIFLWGWGGDVDPTFILSIFLTSQIENWSDCAWSSPEYDDLFMQQATQIDPQKRKEIVYKMEELVYRESPYIMLAYPRNIESYDTTKFEGWTRSPAEKGGVWFTTIPDSYVKLKLKQGETTGTDGGGLSTTNLIIIIVVAVAVVVGIIVAIILIRRPKAVEE